MAYTASLYFSLLLQEDRSLAVDKLRFWDVPHMSSCSESQAEGAALRRPHPHRRGEEREAEANHTLTFKALASTGGTSAHIPLFNTSHVAKPNITVARRYVYPTQGRRGVLSAITTSNILLYTLFQRFQCTRACAPTHTFTFKKWDDSYCEITCLHFFLMDIFLSQYIYSCVFDCLRNIPLYRYTMISLTCLPAYGHIGCFHFFFLFFAIIDSPVMNIFVHISLNISFNIYYSK